MARWGEEPAYAVPPTRGRAYHPDGNESLGTKRPRRGKALRNVSRDAGYELSHSIAILFEPHPEFVFHYYTLNAVGCSDAPNNPDDRNNEIRYVVEHSDGTLAGTTFVPRCRVEPARHMVMQLRTQGDSKTYAIQCHNYE